MTEHPILLSEPMVRAILAGYKTQTRRVVRPPLEALPRSPYGQAGDRLYVREAWRRRPDGGVLYRASEPSMAGPWKPGIHLPKADSRIWLRVAGVTIERLQAITGEDVLAEGIGQPGNERGIAAAGGMTPKLEADLRGKFRALWDGLNAKRGYPWSSDPWAWVVRFEVASTTGRAEART